MFNIDIKKFLSEREFSINRKIVDIINHYGLDRFISEFNRLLLFPSVKEAQVKHSAIKKEIEKLQKKIEEERKLIDRIEESLENLEETYFDCTDF